MIHVGLLGPGVHYLFTFWAVAQVKDERLSEEGKSWSKETLLMNKKVSLGHNFLGGWAEDECLLG